MVAMEVNATLINIPSKKHKITASVLKPSWQRTVEIMYKLTCEKGKKKQQEGNVWKIKADDRF